MLRNKQKRSGKEFNKKSQTPQPSKEVISQAKKTPKSEPPVKRKKLEEEIEDELSDDEFEKVLGGLRAKEKDKRIKGLVTPKKTDDIDDEDDDVASDDDDAEDDDSDDGSDDDDDADDDSEEGSDDDGSEGSEEEESSDEEEKASKPKHAKEETGVKTQSAELAVMVKNLPKDVKTVQLKKLCPSVADIRLPNFGGKKRLAFLEFPNNEAAKKAVEKLQGKTVNGNKIQVKLISQDSHNAKKKQAETTKKVPVQETRTFPEPPEDERDPCKLYVTGFMHVGIGAKDLKSIFSTAKDIVVITTKSRKKKGKQFGGAKYAFPVFENPKACQKAHDKTQSHKLSDGSILVVRYAKKKAEPQKRKQETNKAEPPAKKSKKEEAKSKKVEKEPQKETKSKKDDKSKKKKVPTATLR